MVSANSWGASCLSLNVLPWNIRQSSFSTKHPLWSPLVIYLLAPLRHRETRREKDGQKDGGVGRVEEKGGREPTFLVQPFCGFAPPKICAAQYGSPKPQVVPQHLKRGSSELSCAVSVTCTPDFKDLVWKKECNIPPWFFLIYFGYTDLNTTYY